MHSCLLPSQVLYKLDKHGHGEEILIEDLNHNTNVSFVGFSHEMFIQVGPVFDLHDGNLLVLY